MSNHMPPLKVSPNTFHEKTVGIETGRRNSGEPNFRGHWVIRDHNGTFIDCYEFMINVEQFHPEAVRVPDVDHGHDQHREFSGYAE